MKFPTSITPNTVAVDRKSGTSPPLCPHGKPDKFCLICNSGLIRGDGKSPFIADTMYNSHLVQNQANWIVRIIVWISQRFRLFSLRLSAIARKLASVEQVGGTMSKEKRIDKKMF